MRAKDSVKDYKETLERYTNYAKKSIKYVCSTIGPRLSGSEAEHHAINYMANDLRDCCDEVAVEPFKLHPRAFMAWVQLAVICSLLALASFFTASVFAVAPTALYAIGFGLTAVALFFSVTEFLFYRETLDKFASEETSHNAVGIRKAQGELKRRIIFSGHADSAMEWVYTYRGGGKFMVFMIVCGIVGMVSAFVLNTLGFIFVLAGVSAQMFLKASAYASLVFVPFLVADYKFYNPNRAVDGANDNLTGCFCSMAVMKYLEDNDIKLENTEVWCVCTGSEEAGLRGAKAFCEKHGKDFNDVETIFVGLDTMRDFDYFAVYDRDMTGTVKNDRQVCDLVQKAAQNAGYKLPFKSVFFGASDAAAVSKYGMKAATLAAMDPEPARYYHTRLDTADNLDEKSITAGIAICLDTLFMYDEAGLSGAKSLEVVEKPKSAVEKGA